MSSLLDYFDVPIDSNLEKLYLHNKKCIINNSLKKQKNVDSLKVVFWNICGISNKLKTNKNKLKNITYLEEWLDEHEPDVLCIQETQKRQNSEKIKLSHDCNYSCFESRSGVNPYHNKVFIIKQNTVIHSTANSIREGKNDCHYVIIKTIDSILVIVNMYIQSQSIKNEEVPFLKRFYKKITEKIKDWKNNNYKIIIGGDYNSETTIDLNKTIKKKRLIEQNFVRENSLFLRPMENYTFRRGNIKSNIDRVYCFPDDLIKYNFFGPNLGGTTNHPIPDHRPICNILSSIRSVYTLKDRKIYKWSNLSEEEWSEIDDKMINESKVWFSENEETSSQKIMNHICERYYGIRESNTKHFFIKPNSVPYYDNQLKKIKERLKKMRRKKYKKHQDFD